MPLVAGCQDSTELSTSYFIHSVNTQCVVLYSTQVQSKYFQVVIIAMNKA